jgi:serine/threonine protein kinase
MTSLSLSEISYAIQKNPDLSELVKGDGFEPIWFEKLAKNPKKPKSYAGNFAVTYHFRSKGFGGNVQDYGIRMWHSAVKSDDIERYLRLNNELEKINKKSPNYIRFAPMELLEPPDFGILVKGNRHPCLKMEWQDAENLDVFVDRIMKDRVINPQNKSLLLRELKQKIIEMGRLLHEARCSHGDLSSGNLMVSQKKDGQLMVHVIDFDSFYSHAFSNLAATSIGHEDWQHPDYISGKLNMFGLSSDYCPLLCLIITLEALATDFMLYDQFSPPSQDGGGIIIRKKDLVNPQSSPVIKEMLNRNNAILTIHIDDLFTLLEAKSKSKVKRPKSLEVAGSIVSRPSVNAIVAERRNVAVGQKVDASWTIRKKIESEADLVSALESGPTQMAIFKALNNIGFSKKFNDKTKLRFWELVIEHFGGLDNCVQDITTQYVWALNNAGQNSRANEIADILFDKNPSDPNLGFLVFRRLRNTKKWDELLEVSSRTLDLCPTNVNVNIFHSTALLHTNHGAGVEKSFADARVRTNDDWRILCEIIRQCSSKKFEDEDLTMEVFSELMLLDKDHLNKKIVRKKDFVITEAIINFISSTIKFGQSDFFAILQSMLIINPRIMKLCLTIKPQMKKRLISSIEKIVSMNGENIIPIFSSTEIISLCEILSLLAIWGTGDRDKQIAEKIQLLVSKCEWSDDGLPIGLTFDTSYPPDYLMLWSGSQWLRSRDRSPIERVAVNIWG